MIRLTRHFLLFTLKYFLMKTKTRDKTKRKRIETKRRRWNMKAFWLPATEFPSLQKEMRRQRYCGCFFSFSFTKRHTASRSNTPTVIASPYLSTLFMNERINEKKKKRRKQTKRTSQQTRVLHSRVIPEVALPRFTWLTSVWCGQNEENQGGGGGTSWDGTESRQDDATREFRRREGWVFSWNENSRHFWFELCVDLYSSFIKIKNIPHRRPN